MSPACKLAAANLAGAAALVFTLAVLHTVARPMEHASLGCSTDTECEEEQARLCKLDPDHCVEDEPVFVKNPFERNYVEAHRGLGAP